MLCCLVTSIYQSYSTLLAKVAMTIFGRKAQPSVVLVQRHYVNTIAVASKLDSYNLWVHSVMAAEGFSVGPVHGLQREEIDMQVPFGA